MFDFHFNTFLCLSFQLTVHSFKFVDNLEFIYGQLDNLIVGSVVSSGLFWFYSVSFSYNEVYFHRFFFNGMLGQFNSKNFYFNHSYGSIHTYIVAFCLHWNLFDWLWCYKQKALTLKIYSIVQKQTKWERNNAMETTGSNTTLLEDYIWLPLLV